MKKQLSFLCVILAFVLSACSEQVQEKFVQKTAEKVIKSLTGIDVEVIDPNTPLPEQPSVPNFLTDEEIKNKMAENQEYINRKIIQKDGKTIYYFQEEKQENNKTIYTLTDDKNNAKYYRIILGKTAENYCAVQDFYINGEKRREPYIMVDTDCTQFSDKDNPHLTNQIKDYLTLVSYRPQEKIQSVNLVNRQNKTVTFYYYSTPNKENINDEHWYALMIVHNDFNENKRQIFFINNKQEIHDTVIDHFNEQQIIERIVIANIPYKEDKNETSVELARQYTNIDLEHSTFEVTGWRKEDSGEKSVTKGKVTNSKMDIDNTLNHFKKQHKNAMRAKKLIDIK